MGSPWNPDAETYRLFRTEGAWLNTTELPFARVSLPCYGQQGFLEVRPAAIAGFPAHEMANLVGHEQNAAAPTTDPITAGGLTCRRFVPAERGQRT